MGQERPPVHRRGYQRLGDSILSLLNAVFFNMAVKLAAFRLLLLAILIILYLQLQYIVQYHSDNSFNFLPILLFKIIPLVVFFLHHVLSAFKTWLLPRWLDLVLLGGELVFVWGMWFFDADWVDISWMSSSLSTQTTIAWTCLTIVLVFLSLCRIGAIIRHLGKNLIKPFDLLEDHIQGISARSPPEGLSLFVGQSIWRHQFLGEALYVRLLRGVIAGCIVMTMVIYGLMAIAIQPALESAFIPIKQTRTALYDYHDLTVRHGPAVDAWRKVMEDVHWNFYFSPVSRDFLPRQVNLQDKINVTSYYFQRIDPLVTTTTCTNESVNSNSPNPSTIRIRCPSYINSIWQATDVVISVDFTNLEFGPMGTNAIAVYPSLTDDFDVMLRETVPFPLTQGVNFLATMSIKGRTAYEGRNLMTSSLGLFESPKPYLVPVIQHVVPDPLALRPPGISANVSYLRLTVAFDTGEFRVEADQREKTALAGFATVGGLFTFISGMFAILFGTTLLRLLFDIKTLSIFGIAQNWEKEKIVKAYLEAYPMLRAELEGDPSQRGVVAVMQDHLVDMKPFKEALEAEQRSSSSIELILKPADKEERSGLKEDWVGDLEQGEEAAFGDDEPMLLSAETSRMVPRNN